MTTLPSLAGLPPVEARPFEGLPADLLGVIGAAITNRPRSRQAKLGPSEIGCPCARRLGYKLAGMAPVNTGPPAWRPQVGVAVHEWLAAVFAEDNRHLGAPRWLVEFKVSAGVIGPETLDGSCDLFDRATGTSVDWKVVGPTTLTKARATADPGDQYRAQGHTYGLGWTRRGLHVQHVAVMYLPSNGELSQSVFWSEPFDPGVAGRAIDRANLIDRVVRAGGIAAAAGLPTADAFCSGCPYFAPAVTDATQACPGHRHAAERAARDARAVAAATA